ncbi:MAG: hypothetical protein IJD43_10640 [Thermoguttaceae bacterium]|nr:hypothetical protein [Thermoguttaceae bacterium]
MNTNHSRMHARRTDGFTLIELMLATGLALFLLLGLVKIISMVNTTFADTRVLIDLQNQCRSAQMLLQEDLAHISVVPKAPRPVEMDDGFLCLGTTTRNVSDSSRYTRGDLRLIDRDVNEIEKNGRAGFAAFTVFNREKPFTFTDPKSFGNSSPRTMQTPYAEVIWFVYKNDLYRMTVPFVNSPAEPRNYYSANAQLSASVSSGMELPFVRMISPGMLGDFQNRAMRAVWDSLTGNSSFQTQDLQASMILPNVVMFEIQLYDPREKRYRAVNELNNSQYYDPQTFRHPSRTTGMSGIDYDSGSTLSYLGSTAANDDSSVYKNRDMYDTNSYQPPTTAFVPGMRIIVRAFDPDSGTVREFRVGRDFQTR